MDPVEEYLIFQGAIQWSELADIEEEEARETLKQVVPQAVEIDRPLPNLDTGYDVVREGSDEFVSQKPSNVNIEFDIKTVLVAMAEAGPIITGEPVAVGCGIAALSAIVLEEMTTELSPEAGFLYVTAYDEWGLNEPVQQSTVVETVCKRADDHLEGSDISTSKAKAAIEELEDINCLEVRNHEGNPVIILKEKCENYWA